MVWNIGLSVSAVVVCHYKQNKFNRFVDQHYTLEFDTQFSCLFCFCLAMIFHTSAARVNVWTIFVRRCIFSFSMDVDPHVNHFDAVNVCATFHGTRPMSMSMPMIMTIMTMVPLFEQENKSDDTWARPLHSRMLICSSFFLRSSANQSLILFNKSQQNDSGFHFNVFINEIANEEDRIEMIAGN